MSRPPLLLYGIPIEDVTLDETVALIGDMVASGRERSTTSQIATVNVDFLANAVDDPAIASILRDADLCLADGMPLVWAGTRLGMPVAERVAGADLVPRLFDESQTTGWHVHVFGSSPDVAERAEAIVVERYPDAVVSFDPGPIVDRDGGVEDEALDRLAAVGADIVCVALGNPKQEHFIRRHRDRIGAPVMIGVGGSLDMMVGERRRAPEWVQRVGLEWVVRAAQEPKRLGVRYARDIRTMGPWLFRQWRANRARRSRSDLRISTDGDGVQVGPGTSPASSSDWTAAAERLARRDAVLTITAADRGAGDGMNPGDDDLNDRAAARLVGLVRIARRSGAPIVWSGSPGGLVDTFTELQIPPGAVGCDHEWQPEHTG